MIHYSKKDAWLVAVVVASIFIPLSLGVFFLFAAVSPWAAGAMLLTAGAMLVLIFLLTYPVYYEITSSGLTIRGGLLVRQQIPFGSIRAVSPTRSLLSAPAWSLDRLRVDYDGGYALISPQDKARFMQELADSDPGLAMKDGRLVRAWSDASE